VSKLQANQVEKIYSKFAIQIENSVRDEPSKKLAGKVQSILSDLESSLKKIKPTKQQFTEGFNELEYGRSENARKLVTYILSKFNYYCSSGENKIDFANVNIEHILPQKPGKAWGLKKSDVKGYVDKIGNLALVSTKYNSSMGNNSISEKTKMLEKSEIKATNTLAKEIIANGNKWGEKEIFERHKRMADEAYDKIFAI
jgi:ABC-type dipeptide/oligopeptide/nickel transport system ATPase subunit